MWVSLTLLAALANPGGRVYAFEPMPVVFDRLNFNIALNHLDNVECLASAAGAIDGTASFFHLSSEIPSSSSLSHEFMRASGNPLDCIQVSVIRLDRFVEEKRIPRVDLLKIDTESTEPQVLQGMANVLGARLPRCDLRSVARPRQRRTAWRDFGFFPLSLLSPLRPRAQSNGRRLKAIQFGSIICSHNGKCRKLSSCEIYPAGLKPMLAASINRMHTSPVRCPACAGRNVRLFGAKSGYTLLSCRGCDVIFTRESAYCRDLVELYDHYYDNARFESAPPYVIASLATLAKSFLRFRRTGRWLDFGFGEGTLLGIAQRQGWDCYGTEILRDNP